MTTSPKAVVTPAPVDGANRVFKDKNAFLKHASALGVQDANGKKSGPQFLEDCCLAVTEGLLGTSPDDAKEAWTAYVAGKRSDAIAGIVTDDLDASATSKNFAQKASVVRAVLICAARNEIDFRDTLARARPIIVGAKSDGKTKKNTWDAFYAIALAQKQQFAKGGVAHTMSDEEIAGAIAVKAPEKKERTEQSSLEAIIKSVKVHLEGTNATENSNGKEAFPSAEVSRALACLEERLAVVMLYAARAKQ